jgi:hypothetical protein
MIEFLDLPDFFYTEALKLFIFELTAAITTESIELESGNYTEEYKRTKRQKLGYSIMLSSQLSDDYREIVNEVKTLDVIDRRVFNAMLDNLSHIKRETNSEEEMLEIMYKRMEKARQIINDANEKL